MGFNQKINDAMNNMSRSVTVQMMEDAPADLKYVYIGPVDEKTRPFCLEAASQGALTKDEILALGGEYAESLVSGGGINCRHNWELASDDIQSQFHRGGQAQKILDAKVDKQLNTFTTTSQADKYIENVALKNLTEREVKGIKSWSEGGQLVYVLKEKLLSGKKLSEKTIGIVNRLNKSLNKMPNYKGTVYRGLSFDNIDEYINFKNNFRKGTTTSFPAFTSTSLSIEEATKFASQESLKVLLTIESKQGKWLGKLSAYPDELEVLFKSNSLFEVKDIKDAGVGTLRITLKEI